MSRAGMRQTSEINCAALIILICAPLKLNLY
jgi:hypothetical protein